MAVLDVSDSAKVAVKELIEDGVEFKATAHCLGVFFHDRYGISFGQRKRGSGWVAMKDGFKLGSHSSFHEMLQSLLDTYVEPNRSDQ